eukprot:PhM_4_TR427/c7_g1_i1/m.14909/K08829/MAK; male germ cell-associated kinase
MDRFEVIKQIGDGAFGSVVKAINKKTKEVVAIKCMKQQYYSWEQCMQLREVAALRKLNNHPNIVKLKEVIREQTKLYFIFEFMDSGDLLGLMKQHAGSRLPHTQIRNIMFQVLQALCYIHRQGYFHRDMKPENILLKSSAGGDVLVKIGDFGLAKEIRCKPPLTDYVSTRWYRAPEVLLQDKTYNSPIDMWAVGCILAELYTLRPLFPGTSEVDQLFKITSVLGTPTETTFPDGLRMARAMRYTFPTMTSTSLSQLLPKQTPQVAIDFMEKLLLWDPKNRMSAAAALQHPYFNVMVDSDDLGVPQGLSGQPKKEREAISAPPTTLSSPTELPAPVRGGSRGTAAAMMRGKQSHAPIPISSQLRPSETASALPRVLGAGSGIDPLSEPAANNFNGSFGGSGSLLSGARYIAGKNMAPTGGMGSGLPPVAPPTLSALRAPGSGSPHPTQFGGTGSSSGSKAPTSYYGSTGSNNQGMYGSHHSATDAFGSSFGRSPLLSGGPAAAPSGGGGSATTTTTTSLTGMRRPSWGTAKYPGQPMPAIKRAPL